MKIDAPFFADKRFVKKDYRNQKLPKGDYENCDFEECLFQEGFLDNQHFTECRFLNCDLTNSNITNTQFNDVLFDGCKLLGIHFDTCNPLLLNLQFKGCNLSLASFYEMGIAHTKFDDCELHHVDFAMANLTKCSFHQCDLTSSVFEGSTLEGADFTSAFNFSIDPTKNKIKKAKFSKEGLIGLLKKYDIVVE